MHINNENVEGDAQKRRQREWKEKEARSKCVLRTLTFFYHQNSCGDGGMLTRCTFTGGLLPLSHKMPRTIRVKTNNTLNITPENAALLFVVFRCLCLPLCYSANITKQKKYWKKKKTNTRIVCSSKIIDTIPAAIFRPAQELNWMIGYYFSVFFSRFFNSRRIFLFHIFKYVLHSIYTLHSHRLLVRCIHKNSSFIFRNSSTINWLVV